jgi:hypothetical protein
MAESADGEGNYMINLINCPSPGGRGLGGGGRGKLRLQRSKQGRELLPKS